MIDLYPKYQEAAYTGQESFYDVFQRQTQTDVIPFSCARAAMVYGLQQRGFTRRDEILVPPYIGQCVVSALSKTAFPVLTSSKDTKAIMVFHQFGFPQNTKKIEQEAKKNGWLIVNNCSNALWGDHALYHWGDFTVFSIAKFFVCGMGGGLTCDQKEMLDQARKDVQQWQQQFNFIADEAMDTLLAYHQQQLGDRARFDIEALFGYVPHVLGLPVKAHDAMPHTEEVLQQDMAHRREIWSLMKQSFPDRVPQQAPDNLTPFAIPLRVDDLNVEQIQQQVRDKFNIDMPVLHFDFNQNMLDPDYQPALVVGCYEEWTMDMVQQISEMIHHAM